MRERLQPFRGATNDALIRLGIVAALLVIWQIYAQYFANPALVAPPSAVFASLTPGIFANAGVRNAIGMTLLELVVAFLISVVVGIAIGIPLGLSEFGRRGLYPMVLVLYAIPQVVLLPLVVLIFGIGPVGKIAFGVSHGLFPILVNTVTGMRTVDAVLLAGARTMGASQAQIVRHLIIPNMIGTVFTGLRFAMTMTLLGVILAELFVSTNGVGYFTQLYAESLKPAPLFALILTLACIAIGINESVRLLEHRMTRWKRL